MPKEYESDYFFSASNVMSSVNSKLNNWLRVFCYGDTNLIDTHRDLHVIRVNYGV